MLCHFDKALFNVMTTIDQNKLSPKKPEQEFGKITPTSKGSSTDFSEVYSFFKTLAIFLALAFLLRASIVEAFKIPSESMKQTLQKWDHILVCKFSYGIRIPFMRETLFNYSQPERGDVVVFTRPDDPTTPEDDSAINIIKRVVGLPGDTVMVRGSQFFIDGVPQEEPYAIWERHGSLEGEFGPATVPPGHVFLMGDNRDHSKDSRFWEPSKFLDMNLIKGRALIIYWSWSDLSRIGKVIR
jgi:signal peptidase I